MGGKSKFTADLAKTVVDGLSRGIPLTVICRDIRVDDDTVRNWADADESFGRDIARARERGFDAIAAETLSIADDGTNDYMAGKDGPTYNAEHVQRSKLRIDTRLKLLAKWDPKRYGERLDLEVSGPDRGPIDIRSNRDRAKAIASIVAKQRETP